MIHNTPSGHKRQQLLSGRMGFVRRVVVTVLFTQLVLPHVTQRLFAAQEYSLEDLYRIALERAERVMLSEEDLFIAEKGKDKAFSALLPKLTAFGGYTQYNQRKLILGGQVIQPDNATTWGLTLGQTFSLAGREFTALKISNRNIEKSRHDLSSVKEDYLASVSSAYYDVLRSKKSVEIARANVERLTGHKNAAQARLNVGEVTKTDVLRADAELSGAQSEMVRAENAHRLARAVLARLVGLDGEYEIRDNTSEVKELSDSRALVEGCLLSPLDCLKERALSERAELRSLEVQKKIAADQVSFAQGAYWPTVSIGGNYTRNTESPSVIFMVKEILSAGVSLNFPLYEGGLRKAEVSEAKARERQSELAFEDVKKSVFIEVENAYLDYVTQKGILKSLTDQLSFARDNYNAVSRQYDFGVANSIDVIDANSLLITAERQLTDATYGYELSILRIKRATGTLLTTVLNSRNTAALGARNSK